MGCLFCGYPESNPQSDTGADLICSRCVQRLLAADQLNLKKAHAKAIDKGYLNKAKAISIFLMSEENINGQRKPVPKNHRRNIDRKRIVRAIGDKEKRIERS